MSFFRKQFNKLLFAREVFLLHKETEYALNTIKTTIDELKALVCNDAEAYKYEVLDTLRDYGFGNSFDSFINNNAYNRLYKIIRSKRHQYYQFSLVVNDTLEPLLENFCKCDSDTCYDFLQSIIIPQLKQVQQHILSIQTEI